MIHESGGGGYHWEAGIWSCDLRANKRPWKKLHSMAQTYIHAYRHGNSMTNSAQWGRVGEKLMHQTYGAWWHIAQKYRSSWIIRKTIFQSVSFYKNIPFCGQFLRTFFCGHFLWSLFCGHFLWTLFVVPFCGTVCWHFLQHFLWTLFVDTFCWHFFGLFLLTHFVDTFGGYFLWATL